MADRRLEKLYGRRTTTDIPAELLNEAYSRLEEDEAIKYAIGAMQEIDPAYTQNTFKEGYRVENQLNTRLNRESKIAEFCFQGSVMCDTHIKAYSDIDLVTLTNKFYTLEPPLVPTSPYTGDALEDLKNLRKICAEELKSAFPEAHLDESKSKALSLEGGSLRRKVDIVIGSWWDTVDYNRTNLEHFRGINVLDLHHNCRINNKPFL